MGLARARAPSLSAGAPRLAACPADEARPCRRVGPPAVPRSRVRTCDIARGDRNRMNVEAPEQGLNAVISAVPRDGKASNWFRYGFGKASKIPVTVTVTFFMVTQTPGHGDGGFAALPYRNRNYRSAPWLRARRVAARRVEGRREGVVAPRGRRRARVVAQVRVVLEARWADAPRRRAGARARRSRAVVERGRRPRRPTPGRRAPQAARQFRGSALRIVTRSRLSALSAFRSCSLLWSR